MSAQADRRRLTVGLMMCVMAIAFESYAVLTAMPAAARDLGNLDLYAWTFTAFVIAMHRVSHVRSAAPSARPARWAS